MIKKLLKVGDKVRVIPNLELNSIYGGYIVTSSMFKLRGKTTTITKVNKEFGNIVYNLNGSNSNWRWTPEMLEEASSSSSTIRIAFNGSAVIAKIGDEQGIALCNTNVDEFNENEGIRIAVCRALRINPFKLEEPIIKSLKDYTVSELIEELAKKLN